MQNNAQEFVIEGRRVGGEQPCFIIAEVGNNHNGSLKIAKEMVDAAKEAGVDAVKFQMRQMNELYGDAYKTAKSQVDLGAQYTLDLLAKFQLSNEQMLEVFEYCKKKGIIGFCTPWDEKSVGILENYGINLYKVASADLTNHVLLSRIAKTRKPLICSTGMATEKEIEAASSLLKNAGASFAFLHCNSTYPTPFKDVNLGYLQQLRKYSPIIGYSGHERGFHIPIAAVALGAKIIEKHFTFDKTWEGVDHRVSLLPDETRQMVERIRELEMAMQSPETRSLSQGELINRENLGKSVVMNVPLSKGQVFKESMLGIKSPGQGLAPYYIKDLVGKVAKRDLSTGDVLFPSDLESVEKIKPKPFKFKRPWGVPVRYHDTSRFLGLVRPDILEFHLSYNDMEENVGKYLSGRYECDFAVHAPELFAGDHLLDLCSPDREYQNLSMKNMERVIEITIALKKYFPKTKKPLIIGNLGGFTKDKPLPEHERKNLYGIIYKNLEKLKTPEVEIIPQNMAPFPWHFGGQQYQNLFKFPEEMKWFCEEYGYRLCMDISHAQLTINYHGYTLESYHTLVAPHSAHLHLGDSKGVDGEGLQIGEGEIDFNKLAAIYNKSAPTASFIPEIWQGHKNDGEGFWVALGKLEGIL